MIRQKLLIVKKPKL